MLKNGICRKKVRKINISYMCILVIIYSEIYIKKLE